MPNHVIVSSLGWSKQPLEDAIDAIGGLDFGQVDLAVQEGWAHLYPSAQIRNQGFEATRVPENSFALTVGNVPFGRYVIADPSHNPQSDPPKDMR